MDENHLDRLGREGQAVWEEVSAVDSGLLTGKQSIVVNMRVDGLNNQQIARILGISRTEVKRRMQRARLTLAQEDQEWDRRDGK